jgi:hypothetical protein
VDDIERTIRLEGAPVFKPEQKDVTVNVLLPGDLPSHPWSVVLVAEQLAADGKTVVATANTSALTFTPEAPFRVELISTPQAEGRAGLGAAGTFTGKVHRAAGFTQPITLTLSGLPAEVKMIPQLTLGNEQGDFTLPLTFEYGSKAGEYKGLKLAGFVAGSPQPSSTADVELKIVPGEKPE